MLLSPKKKGLTSLFEEVRVFKGRESATSSKPSSKQHLITGIGLRFLDGGSHAFAI